MSGADYDVIIIGGGPAGLAAGIYAVRARLKTLIVEKGRLGGQAATTAEIENYPGFRRGTKASELMDLMAAHARDFGAEFLKDIVIKADLRQNPKLIYTQKGKILKSKTVILAPGAQPRLLGAKGETEFRGKGVSYCATCDADFYEDLEVVVVGNGDAALEEAIYLTRFASRVNVIVIHEEGVLDATKVIQERALSNPKINFIWNSTLEEIQGEDRVNAVLLRNVKTGETSLLPCDGVFIFVGNRPNTEFLAGQVDLDNNGYILTNEQMETSVDGVFAAGDARKKFLYQVITAASDGAVAAFAVEKYLAEEENFRYQVLDKKEAVAVIFWSPTSKESLAVLPLIERTTAELGRVSLVKIDTYKNKRIARRFGVEKVPYLILFNAGEKRGEMELGGKTQDEIQDFLAVHS